MKQEFIRICARNINCCAFFFCICRILVICFFFIHRFIFFIFCIIKIYRYIPAVRFDPVKQYFLTLIFSWQCIQGISRKFLCIFIVCSGIHIKLQLRDQTVKFISTYCADRNLKHILVFCQHIVLDFHLVMGQCRRKQQSEHQQQICKQDPDKQNHIITHILKNHPKPESGKDFHLRTQINCPLLLSSRQIPAQEF